MENRDWISLTSVLVSAIAAIAAIDARNAARGLEKQQFESETTLRLLEEVFEEISSNGDSTNDYTSCIFVDFLGRTEEDVRDRPPFYVRDFVRTISDAGLWNASCSTRLEAFIGEDNSETKPASTTIIGLNDTLPNDTPNKIGQWHALVASYDVTDKGCTLSKEQVDRFSSALADKGFEDFFVYVAKTKISNNYAVTIDAGDSLEMAREISAAIRDVARQEEDKTGIDSFVQGNRGWSIDPKCKSFANIKS